MGFSSFISDARDPIGRTLGYEEGESPIQSALGLPGTKDLFGGLSGETAARAAERAAATEAEYKQQALDYLYGAEAIPRLYRESATVGLGGLYGIGDSNIMEQIEANPVYQAQMRQAALGSERALEEGEEAILRNRAMTGGFRSGGTQRNLSDLASDIQLRQSAAENQALIDAYSRQEAGLRGLAGLQSYAPQIAQVTSGIGETLGAGQVAAGQARGAGAGNIINTGVSVLGSLFSDSRLKTNVEKIGTHNGWDIYSWDWNDKAKEIGLSGSDTGVIAQDVERRCPEAISYSDNGYMMVDYSILGVQ